MKKSTIDYSKWDKFNFDDSDDSDSDNDTTSANNEYHRAISGGNIFNQNLDFSQVPEALKEAFSEERFIKLHPNDDGLGLAANYFMNPSTFIPEVNKETKTMNFWGIIEPPESAMNAFMQRVMKTQFLYGALSGGMKSPEVQWTTKRKEIKEKLIQEVRNRPDAENLRNRDIILNLEMTGVTPKVWRKISVSGNMTLSAFSDKVLIPALGFVRNYHSYVFVDQKDGAVFAPLHSQAIDAMHRGSQGIEVVIDDTTYKLGDVFVNIGDKFEYTYDLGDFFCFLITLDSYAPKTTGKVELLGGEFEGPPEDSNGQPKTGNKGFQEFLEMKQKQPNKYKKALSDASNSSNLRTRTKYDPHVFDIEAARERIKQALASSASTQSGKVYNYPGHGFCREHGGDGGGPSLFAGKNERSVSQPTDFGATMQETIRTGKDPKNISLCASCGSPNNLKVCSTCKKIKYCSRECQKAHWKTHKQSCVSAKKK